MVPQAPVLAYQVMDLADQLEGEKDGQPPLAVPGLDKPVMDAEQRVRGKGVPEQHAPKRGHEDQQPGAHPERPPFLLLPARPHHDGGLSRAGRQALAPGRPAPARHCRRRRRPRRPHRPRPCRRGPHRPSPYAARCRRHLRPHRHRARPSPGLRCHRPDAGAATAPCTHGRSAPARAPVAAGTPGRAPVATAAPIGAARVAIGTARARIATARAGAGRAPARDRPALSAARAGDAGRARRAGRSPSAGRGRGPTPARPGAGRRRPTAAGTGCP